MNDWLSRTIRWIIFRPSVALAIVCVYRMFTQPRWFDELAMALLFSFIAYTTRPRWLRRECPPYSPDVAPDSD